VVLEVTASPDELVAAAIERLGLPLLGTTVAGR
jgi:hypothetical protein